MDVANFQYQRMSLDTYDNLNLQGKQMKPRIWQMKRNWLLLISLLLFLLQQISLANYCEAAPTVAPTKPASAAKPAAKVPAVLSARAQAKPGNKILMWKATAENGATLYLLGTIHVFRHEYYPLPLDMENAFDKSRALLVEIDLSKSDPAATKALVIQKGIYPQGDDLTQHVSREVLEQLQAYSLKSGGLPMQALVHMKPWMAAITIMEQEVEKLGYSPKEGIDRHFITEANEKGKKVIGLETEEFQLGVFSDLSPELQEQMLKLTLVDMALLKDDANSMMKCWLEGDENSLVELMTKDVREHPELAPVDEKLLYERNITMEKKLEAYLKGLPDDVFIVAVGSGHLVGPRSIVDLLKQKGYKVEQMTVAPASSK